MRAKTAVLIRRDAPERITVHDVVELDVGLEGLYVLVFTGHKVVLPHLNITLMREVESDSRHPKASGSFTLRPSTPTAVLADPPRLPLTMDGLRAAVNRGSDIVAGRLHDAEERRVQREANRKRRERNRALFGGRTHV